MLLPHHGPIQSEDHWLRSVDPERMEEFLGESGSERRWRLFACHCCYRILPLLTDERCLRAVALAERMAEGPVQRAEVDEALEAAREAELEAWVPRRPFGHYASAPTAARRSLDAPRRAYQAAADAAGSGAASERAAQCGLLRELFGNPFRPARFEPTWRSPTVLTLARDIDAREAYAELPVLADALEDAGCDGPELLGHLRGPRAHILGCWALDLLLSKE